MRIRFASIFAASALLISAGVSLAPAAGASRGPSVRHSHAGHVAAPAHLAGGVLYDQYDNDSGTGISSQTFEAALDVYNDAAADDFTVHGGRWVIKEVDVAGVYYNGFGPALSETVTFYQDAGGAPGAAIASQTVRGTDRGGSFALKLSPVKLQHGTYWVSVVVNMRFGAGGQWGWEARSVRSGNLGQWENPNDGFGTGCTTWGATGACTGITGIPDYMFALLGGSR